MQKIKISNNAFGFPLPMVLVGTIVQNVPNFMAVGWVNRVNYHPPMIAIGLGRMHWTNPGLIEHKQFSINVPSLELVEKTDYCGIASGKDHDKSKLFSLFSGELAYAPMIVECPLNMECRLFQTVELPSNTIFIGEIVNAYTEEQYISDGQPDIKKIAPFCLTMPDCNYWKLGEPIAKAWSVGKKLMS